MEVFRTTIESGGRIQIPSQMLEELEFAEGQAVEIEVEKKSLRVYPSKNKQRKEAQAFVISRFGKTNSAVDEFIEERRREALND